MNAAAVSKQGDKPLHWMGSALDDLKDFPDDVQDVMGFNLRLAQQGEDPDDAKPLVGYKGVEVWEILDDYKTNTYRLVYTIKFKKAVYVLHAFQKKSKQGIKTPKHDLDVIKLRLQCAEEHYKKTYSDPNTQ